MKKGKEDPLYVAFFTFVLNGLRTRVSKVP